MSTAPVAGATLGGGYPSLQLRWPQLRAYDLLRLPQPLDALVAVVGVVEAAEWLPVLGELVVMPLR